MGIYFRLVFFLICGFFAPLFSTSIQIVNDSAFVLNAQVLDRTGTLLDIIHLIAGQMYIYDVSQGSFEPNSDETCTPYTVIFLCESGRPYDYSIPKKEDKQDPNQKKVKPSEYISQFGIWTGVPRGATVTALTCPEGTKSCVMKKHPKILNRNRSNSSTNAGSGNWSNDGGQSWSNDAGSSEGSCSRGDASCLSIKGRRDRSQRGTSTSNSPTDKTIMNDEGEFVENDGGDEFSNDSTDTSTSGSEQTDPPSKWSNDQDDPPHIPTKKTPLPFQSRS